MNGRKLMVGAVSAAAVLLSVGSSAEASSTAGARPAAAHTPTMTLSSSTVHPGTSFTVAGRGCEGDAQGTYGVDVTVVTARGKEIAETFVRGPISGGKGIKHGAWKATVKLAKSVKPANYLVAADCDQYTESFNYKAAALKIRLPLSLKLSAPHSVKAGHSAVLVVRSTSAKGAAVAKERVTVFARAAKSHKAVKVATIVTSGKGTVKLTVHPKVTTTYRGVAAQGAVYDAATSKSATVSVKKKTKK